MSNMVKSNLVKSAAVCLVLGLVPIANAQVVRVTTTGVMHQSNIDAISVSDEFVFSFDVDLSMSVDSSPHPSTGAYEGAVIGFDLEVGNYEISGTGAATAVFSHYPEDIDGYNMILNSVDHFAHEFVRSIDFELVHFGGTQFDSTHLSEIWELGDISAWSEVRSIRVTGTTPTVFAQGTVYSIEVQEVASECVADLTDDGMLNFLDVSQFLSLFGAQDPASDINDDQMWNFLDVSEFLSAFAAGCP